MTLKAEYRHTPVLLSECRQALALQAGDIFCDCTLGGAGHSLELAKDLAGGLLIGIDQDRQALEVASSRIAVQHPQLKHITLHGNFAELDALLLQAQVPGINACLFDLGVSSPQLDTPQRGFSYAQEAPLDMRMDPGQPTQTAAELINTLNATELAWVLRAYGEERWAMRIAQAIVTARSQAPIQTTSQLTQLIRQAIPAAARRSGGNPAKRSFQALRIAVNGELDALRTGLQAALRWLLPGGRIAVISYHSLEDRIVKECFATAAKGCVCPPDTPICVCGRVPILHQVSKKPLTPSAAEIAANPRSASAKLRVAYKI